MHAKSPVMANSLWPHGLQHARLLFHLLFPRVGSDSCPLSLWYYLTISASASPFSFCLQSFPASGSFPMSPLFHIRWPEYWSFSISPSNKYSGLIAFRTDWFDLLAVQEALKNLLQDHNLKTSILRCSAPSVHDYWKNHSFDYTDLCQQSDISAFFIYLCREAILFFSFHMINKRLGPRWQCNKESYFKKWEKDNQSQLGKWDFSHPI